MTEYYTMAPEETRTSMTHYFFILLLVAGTALLVFSLVKEQANPLFSGLRQVAIGTTLIGLGEWINHPLQKSVTMKGRSDLIFKRIRHRKRNPSALGNLFEIAGLILVFTGMSDLF
jgi:hypothetical protein